MTNSTDLKSRISALLLEGSPTVLAANPMTKTHELQKMSSEKWESLNRSKKDKLKKIVSRRNEKVLSDVSDDELSTILSKVDPTSSDTTTTEKENESEPEQKDDDTTEKEKESEPEQKDDDTAEKESEPEQKDDDTTEKENESELEQKDDDTTEKENESELEQKDDNTAEKENESELEQKDDDTAEKEKESEPAQKGDDTAEKEKPMVSEPEVEPIGTEADDDDTDELQNQRDGQTDLDLTPNFVNTFFSYVNSLMDKPVDIETKEEDNSSSDGTSNEVVNSTPDYSDPSVFSETANDKPLPEGWEVHISKTSNPGKEYYFNTKTGETVWEKPGVSESESGRDEGDGSLPPGWTAHVSESSDPGKTYYFNESTGETAWEKPKSSLSKTESGEGDSLPPGWTEHVSESSDPGKTYFHNAETGETVWEKPSTATLKTKTKTEGATKDVVEGQCYKCGNTQNLHLKTYKLNLNGAQPVHFCSFKCFEGIEF